MPITVEKTIKARLVRVGDEVQFPGIGITEMVADVSIPRSSNAKYAVISTDYGKKRIELSEDVTVFRLEPTEEEAEAARLERTIRSIMERRSTLENLLVQYREDLISNLDMRDQSWHGRKWTYYAETQFELELWNSVFMIAKNREVNLAEALNIFVEYTRVEFIRRGNFSPRSTSAINNYVETMQNEITARFLRDYEMFGF